MTRTETYPLDLEYAGRVIAGWRWDSWCEAWRIIGLLAVAGVIAPDARLLLRLVAEAASLSGYCAGYARAIRGQVDVVEDMARRRGVT